MSYDKVSVDEYQRLYAENERLTELLASMKDNADTLHRLLEQAEARTRALEEALERIVNTYGVGLGTELLSEARAALARVRALEAECEGHKEAFASMLAEAELCGSVNEDLQARVAALEEALRGAMKKLQRYGEQTEDESAALARPAPTPQGEKG